MYQKINSLEELKQKALNNNLECFLLLNGGFRSSKVISYYEDKTFYILNEIDGSEEELTEEELEKLTLIPEAIEKGALYLY